jgi:hypothetical protein
MYIPSDFFFRVKSISSLLVDRVEDLVPRLEDTRGLIGVREFELLEDQVEKELEELVGRVPVDMVTFTNMVTVVLDGLTECTLPRETEHLN